MNFVLIIAVPLPPNYIKILINHESNKSYEENTVFKLVDINMHERMCPGMACRFRIKVFSYWDKVDGGTH